MPFKSFLRDVLFYTLILFVLSSTTSAITITGGVQTYFIAGAIFALANNLVKPLLNIISIPFMMMSFGLFSLVIGAVILFGITIVYPAVEVHGFNLSSIQLPISLPSIYIPELLSYLVLSVIIELARKLMHFISEE